MKKTCKTFIVAVCCAVSAISVSAYGCDGVPSGAKRLADSSKTTALDYEERKGLDLSVISESAEKFSADFASLVYSRYDGVENFAVSPISAYMALALSAQCSAGETRSQILSSLNISYDDLKENFSNYYRSVIAEYTAKNKGGKEIDSGMISLKNSLWLDSHTQAKRECLDILAEKFFCSSFETPFADDNDKANQAVREYVRQNTKGLIDQNFDISNKTVFTLINTLYFKDMWNEYGDELQLTDVEYKFKQSDGSIKRQKLLSGFYNLGRVVEGKNFKTFFTKTHNGNKLKFILPNDGYTVDDIFTAENITYIKDISTYYGEDSENKQRFYTRCLFPEYEAEFYDSVKDVLADMGITALFSRNNCDFSSLTDKYAYCNDIRQFAKLKVDRKGVEGVAVTISDAPTATGPDGYTEIYEDFVVDKSFAFILSDRFGNTLFSGVVKRV